METEGGEKATEGICLFVKGSGKDAEGGGMVTADGLKATDGGALEHGGCEKDAGEVNWGWCVARSFCLGRRKEGRVVKKCHCADSCDTRRAEAYVVR
mgnify:CR=1 FL=1